MIVGFQPGGTIKHARVILRYGEKLPNRYNIAEAEVYMEGKYSPLPWSLVKPRGDVLPENSDLLSQPNLGPVNILDLTKAPGCDSFEHTDIIRVEEE